MRKPLIEICSRALQQALVNLPHRPAITAREVNAWLATLPEVSLA